MATESDLKLKNAPVLVLFIFWCVALYAVFQIAPDGFWENLQEIFKRLRAKDCMIVILSPVLSIVLNGFVSSENKARLVFWRWKNVLPGHRAFSLLARSDPRIDAAKLRSRLGDVPRAPKEQNALWYELYRRYSTALRVLQAHKGFLLTRDMTSVACMFAILGTFGVVLYGHKPSWAGLYFAIMMAHYVVLSIVARNYGNRFVCTVLVELVMDKNRQPK